MEGKGERFAAVSDVIKTHVPGLDVVRAFAVTWVIWHNFSGPHRTAGDFDSAIGKLFEGLAGMGWMGVQLFFVLSGFLITGILLDSRGRAHWLRNFFMRRFLRIFPVFYATLLVLFVILPLVGTTPAWLTADMDNQVWYWIYLVNWAQPLLGFSSVGLSHLWTLAVEEQFYLVWPLCILLLVNHNRVAWCCLVLVFSATLFRLGVATGFLDLPAEAAYTFTIARWDALAIGGLLAVAVRNKRWFGYLDAWAEFIVALGLIYVFAVIFVTHNFVANGDMIAVANQSVSALLSAWLVYRAVTPGWLSRICSGAGFFSFVRLVGTYSYAMYLFHRPLQYVWYDTFFIPASGPYAVVIQTYNVVIVFVASFVLAAISWRVIERPCLNLKSYFPSQAGGK